MQQAFDLIPKPEKEDEDDVEFLKGRLEEAKANLEVLRLQLKTMAIRKGIPPGQVGNSDAEYWGVEMHAKVEGDVARLETILRAAALKVRRVEGTLDLG